MSYGSLAKKSSAEFAQRELNSSAKNIEFFKLQHGAYPDSLHTLRQEDKFAPLRDPFTSGRRGVDLNYNCKKIGDKYTLFSSGDDLKPNTGDDIDPNVLIPDSSKIGLVKLKFAKDFCA